jgi:hypothetical protein
MPASCSYGRKTCWWVRVTVAPFPSEVELAKFADAPAPIAAELAPLALAATPTVVFANSPALCCSV